MMALTIQFNHLIKEGVDKDEAEIARLGYVARVRVTQITNLPRVKAGKDPLHLKGVLEVAAELEWGRQRKIWRAAIEK
ncbi:MAG: hypothetical protein KDA69_17065 [Planctomycetaceae bacterium]|nr:hypothetical protein [Planctomycetaceae bacterium]MCA9046042.1 hypothetical protein [Planctomycetaceae bacterium]